MASAYKCDRCGVLYSEPSEEFKLIDKRTNTYISKIWLGNSNWDSGGKDLCPKCAEQLYSWWKNGEQN